MVIEVSGNPMHWNLFSGDNETLELHPQRGLPDRATIHSKILMFVGADPFHSHGTSWGDVASAFTLACILFIFPDHPMELLLALHVTFLAKVTSPL